MEQQNERLSRINTLWTVVRQAHDSGASRQDHDHAQSLLMERYCTSVHRYLLGALKDQDAADELFQEFALRFLRGDFRATDSSRGRFRDYVRTVLIHLVNDRHRARKRNAADLPSDVAAPPDSPNEELDDGKFIDSWRAELMNHAWARLLETRPVQHAVLLFHVNNPSVESAQAAKEMSIQLGKAMTATNMRVTLFRARARFAEMLLDEVKRSLGEASDEALLDELKALGLKKICEPALSAERPETAAPDDE